MATFYCGDAMNNRRIDVPRDAEIHLRVSRQERDLLKSLAAAAGLSVSAYLLGLALGDKLGEVIVDSVHRNADASKRKKG